MQDQENGVALWRRVADDLRRLVQDGAFGERLPGEGELAGRYGVNRHTLRRALAALGAEGVLRTERGRGTFINAAPQRVSYAIGTQTRFSANLLEQGRQPEGRLIGAEQVNADPALAARLDCRAGTPLHRLETLHVADGVPLSVATGHFVAERFPRIVANYAETGSITQALEREGCADYRRCETRISAERATARDAGHLGLGADAIVLVTVALDVDAQGRPVQVLRTRFAAERMELLVRTAAPAS